MVKLTIKNETWHAIDLVVGLNNEFRMSPDSEVEVEIKDGDIMYVDQVIKLKKPHIWWHR